MNISKNVIPNQKHLTLSDRTYIEQELLQGSSFRSIAATLRKDPTTISKEVRRYAKDVPQKSNRDCIICKHFADCDVRSREMDCPSYNNKHCALKHSVLINIR